MATMLAFFAATQAGAVGVVERACLGSKRSGADRVTCGCIQQAANLTLSGADQRTASGFFKDPEKAQKIKRSDRRSHEEFWQRYRRFGAVADQFCRR